MPDHNSNVFSHDRFFKPSEMRFFFRIRCRTQSVGRSTLVLLIALLSFSLRASAQGLEFSGGWAHNTQDFGTDGFNVGLAWWFSNKLALAADYDATWDTSDLTTFQVADVGGVSVKGRLQNALVGPRFAFPIRRLSGMGSPFFEAQFGSSSLKQTVSRVITGTQSNAASGFSWMLGGGFDYKATPHWAGRFKLDFLRTHIADEGQSRVRLVLGLAYTIGARE
jgi:outer membrane protein with beta-barrel domain